MAAWIVKSEPTDYPFSQLQKDKRTAWTGIRNFQARNNVRQMKVGELALFFHTGADKAVVGVAKVLTAPAPDPTAKGEDWVFVELGPVKPLVEPVALATLKATAATKELSIVRQGRLSVGPVTKEELAAVLKLSKTRL
jgi:predicted RNA-binding protein with PUA-like domain